MALLYKGAPYVNRSTFVILPTNIRTIHYWIILPICTTALIANCLAIRSTIKGKHRFVQKTCIVCLAVADIFGVIMGAIANLEVLSHDVLIWTLGKFMCSFVPMANTMAIMASSLCLTLIALDRYQNVMSALTKKWDPSPLSCVGFAFALSFFCCVISYPIYTFFELRDIALVTINPYYRQKYVFELVQFCGALVKERLTVYYIIMAFLIFFPMLTVFISFYFNIAVLIWKHRKPVTSEDKNIPVGEDTSTLSRKRSTFSESQSFYINLPKRKNVQVERKIRTFRTVLILMISFFICRLPYWIFYIVQLLSKQNSQFAWNLHFSLIALNLLNCVLDPLLYTFLQETINALKIINDFFFKVCCCCFSNDFEDFERNNPFVIDENVNVKCIEKNTCLPTSNQQQKDKF